MFVYFACSHSGIYFEFLKKAEAKNILLSYMFFKEPKKVLEAVNLIKPKNVIIDSGAFSVWANGQTVDIGQYAKFCHNVKEVFPKDINLYVVNLDVLPGRFGVRPNEQQKEDSAKQGWENMITLEKEGLKVIHVFHQHESFEWLDKLMKHSDYIGVSPANDVSMKEKLNWLNQVFSITKDKIKTHGFAVTSHNQLYRYPFYSVDSSSWTAPSRFGRIPVFCDDLTMKTVEYKNKEQVKKYWDYLKHIGIEKLGSDDYGHRIILSIKSFQQLERIATELWNKRGVKFI